jgi:hypothetical protein
MSQMRASPHSPQPAQAVPDHSHAATRTATGSLPRPDMTARYAVQLRISAVPIDPHSVPRLDIFEMYTLYCDVRVENGTVRHALRLGFFKDECTAKTIAHYLASYFDAPEIVALAPAEHARALGLRLVALQDVGEDSGRHASIELVGSPPLLRQSHKTPAVATASPRAAPRSLWSRLLETAA